MQTSATGKSPIRSAQNTFIRKKQVCKKFQNFHIPNSKRKRLKILKINIKSENSLGVDVYVNKFYIYIPLKIKPWLNVKPERIY